MFGQQLTIKRESGWTFNTSGTGGLGIGFVAASGGEIVLNPTSGEPKASTTRPVARV